MRSCLPSEPVSGVVVVVDDVRGVVVDVTVWLRKMELNVSGRIVIDGSVS
jgi:hypothetical protein